MSTPIDPHLLTTTAFAILVEDLEGHGNVLSDMHRAALYELLETFTGYCTGTKGGRLAFPLPTGMGKTSAVVAFLTALHRLGYQVPVSVAASKVEALCRLKRDLIGHGIPEGLIGLKHAVQNTFEGFEVSTGSESRLFQLITHSRVRSGGDFQLFGTHEGTARPLCVYDETFMRCDAFAFRARAVYIAVGALTEAAIASRNPLLPPAVAYLQTAVSRIKAVVEDIQQRGDPHNNGAPVELDQLDPLTITAYCTAIRELAYLLKGHEPELQAFLGQSQEALRVIGSDQGDGVVTAREVVPPALRNVVILDASSPIRELARLDPSVTVVENFSAADLKSFEAVEVHQLLSPGGRSTISHSLSADRKETSAVALEVARIIREGWDKEQAFLVFTFVRRERQDVVGELKRDLRRSGIDLEAKTAKGQQRINWLTWGSETSLNGMEHCTSVIMAGVLHRSHLDLSAVVRGQTGNPAEPTPSTRLRELVETEIAHCIYQGASRGSCRRIDAGKASPMRLWFIHRSPEVKTILDRVMPGAQWSYPDPQFLKKATADSKAAQLLAQLLAHLRTIPEDVQKVSSRAVKAALGLEKDEAAKKVFTRAADLLDLSEHGWSVDGRSLVRAGVALGFEDRS